MFHTATRCGVLSIVLTISLCAQSAAPFEITGDAFVSDPSTDTLWRLQDLSQDGDFNDPAEMLPYYDSQLGTVALQSNNGVAVGPDGIVYVSDAGARLILALQDFDGNGTANSPGEHWIFFDGQPTGNAAGIAMVTPGGLSVDHNGVVWVAVADSGGSGIDGILRLEDLGGFPGANGPGEALVYAAFQGAGSSTFIPQDVVIGPGGDLYYVDIGTGQPRGIYRLHDDNPPNGVIDGPQEVSLFWTPTAGGVHLYFGLSIDLAGSFYVADTQSDRLYRLRDDSPADGIIDPLAGEEVIAWNPMAASNLWKVVSESSGSLLACEAQSPSRILRLTDITNDGDFQDAGEVTAAYSAQLGPLPIGTPRSIALARRPTLLAPSAPSISAPFLISLDTVRLSLFTLWISTHATSLPIPPFGTLEIQVAPPAFADELLAGPIPPTGRLALPIPALQAPSFIGLTLHLQALTGPFVRPQFTNGATLTFGP